MHQVLLICPCLLLRVLLQEEVAAASKALSKLKGSLAAVQLVQSWAPEGQRTAVVVRKTGPTPQLYPRAPGTPSKKPL